MKQRLFYIDALRGFAIILVVLGHVLQNYYVPYEENIAFRVIYSFHMPLFMFLSGYVSYKICSWRTIEKRAFQCMIPFFSAILLNWFIEGFEDWSIGILMTNVYETILRPDKGLWFLWVLFFINVIFLSMRKISARLHINEIVVMVAVAGIMNGIELVTHTDLFGYHWISWYFMFFAFGAYWRAFMDVERPRMDSWLLVVSAVLFPVTVYFFRMHNEAPTFYQWINLGRYFPIVYRILVAVLGIILCYEVFKHTRQMYNNKSKIVLIGGVR